MTTRAELNAARPTECPNHDTLRTCGKSWRTGCRVGPCLENKQLERKGVPASDRPTPKPRASRVGPRMVFVGGFPDKDKGHSPNWSIHDKCCSGSKVWRPNVLGCLPA